MSQENNILVAEFMGSKSSDVDYTSYNKDGTIEYTANEDGTTWIVTEYSKPDGLPSDCYWGNWIHGHNLKYHTSWDWLMPVVKRIKDMGHFYYWTGDNYITFSMNGDENGKTVVVASATDKDMLKANYKAVIKFIKFYNENK